MNRISSREKPRDRGLAGSAPAESKSLPEVVRPPLGSDAERTAIVDALQRSEFVLSCASRALGVSRATMYRLMRRHQIELRPRYTIESSPESRIETS